MNNWLDHYLPHTRYETWFREPYGTASPIETCHLAPSHPEQWGASKETGMNKPLTTKETNELLCAIDQKPVAPTMTRAQKLHHWATQIRATPCHLEIYHDLEHRTQRELDSFNHSSTAFALAFADPVLREAGLQSGSVGDSMRFFELTRDELHAFSCNCGGSISNVEMAKRIDAIANNQSVVSQRIGATFRSIFR